MLYSTRGWFRGNARPRPRPNVKMTRPFTLAPIEKMCSSEKPSKIRVCNAHIPQTRIVAFNRRAPVEGASCFLRFLLSKRNYLQFSIYFLWRAIFSDSFEEGGYPHIFSVDAKSLKEIEFVSLKWTNYYQLSLFSFSITHFVLGEPWKLPKIFFRL